MEIPLVLGLAYNVLFEQEKEKKADLTSDDFNKWLHEHVNARAKEKK